MWKKITACIFCGAMLMGLAGCSQDTSPSGRMEAIVQATKKGDMETLDTLATDNIFDSLNLLGDSASDEQRTRLMDMLYKDLDVEILGEKIDEDEKSAAVSVKVTNKDVYTTLASVQLSDEEIEKNDLSKQMDILTDKVETALQKNKEEDPIESLIVFHFTQDEEGNWKFDGSNTDNRMAITAFLGVHLDMSTNGDFVDNTAKEK